jgi:hypothetical protein
LANKYIDVITRNGLAPSGSFNTSIQLASNGGLIWQKVRNAVDNHYLIDTVRGISKTLYSNSTNAEGTDANFITAVANGSVTMGSNDWTSSQTVVGWLWGAGGTGVSNTAGTITSTVSANTTSGFSIVTYTGNSTSSQTVGHGLGVAPGMVIVKDRSSGTTNDWRVWHRSLTGGNNELRLNTTAAQATDSTTFSSAPNSTVINYGNNTAVNGSSRTYVAYVFAPVAGYSAFGSYTGNGSTDGPFVFTNFRPRYVMTKRTDSTSNWVIQDTARDTYNATNNALFANLSLADNTGPWFDILSNGFKVRNNGSDTNASSGTYIYMAFSEVAFKYSLGR